MGISAVMGVAADAGAATAVDAGAAAAVDVGTAAAVDAGTAAAVGGVADAAGTAAAYGFGGTAAMGADAALGTGLASTGTAGLVADAGVAGGAAAAGGGGLLSSLTGGSSLGSLAGVGSLAQGAAGLYESGQVGKAAQQGAATANPFAPYYAQYAGQLNSLMANPTATLPNTPGYQAGMQAVERSEASQGYNGSGNMAVALQQYGGNIFQQQEQMLAQLSGLTNSSPSTAGQLQAQGGISQAQLTGNSLNSLLYGTQAAANGMSGSNSNNISNQTMVSNPGFTQAVNSSNMGS